MLNVAAGTYWELDREEIDTPVCMIGMTMQDKLVMLWSEDQIQILRQQLTPEELGIVVEVLEHAFSRFIGSMCGGRQ